MSIQTCPHCEHITEDVFDVLATNFVHEMRACGQCGKPFFYAIIECDHCRHEQVFESASPLTVQPLRACTCPACQRPFGLADDGLRGLL